MATQPNLTAETAIKHTVSREDFQMVWPLPPRQQPLVGC